jgi:hypothetical protein
MGFPLSSLQQLSLLCEREPEERRFDRYKLVAILVAGPNDRAVKEAMTQNFANLDISTGKYFAFITFIEPPLQWKQDHGYRMDSLQGLSEGFSTDEGRMISALRERFGLPESPCLMLTDSLSSDHYAIIPVNENDLVDKMDAIGAFATLRPLRFSVTDLDVKMFLSRFGSVCIEKTEDGNSIGKNIADIRAVDSLLYNTGEYKQAWGDVRRNAEQWVHNTLQELSYKAKSAPEENHEASLKRYSDYLALTLQTVEPTAKPEIPFPSVSPDWPQTDSYVSYHHHSIDEPKRGSFSDRFLIPDEYASYLTSVSQRNMACYNNLVPFLMQTASYEGGDYPSFIPSPGYGLAPLGLYMGHIMEEEINASIVQLSRKNAGVQMPTYYRIWDKTHDALQVLRNEKGTICLNRKGKKNPDGKFSVELLSIGQAALAIRQMKKDHPDYSFGQFSDEAFLSRIADYAYHRNKSAHTRECYSYEDFTAAHKAFSTIFDNDLRNIANLKEQLNT